MPLRRPDTIGPLLQYAQPVRVNHFRGSSPTTSAPDPQGQSIIASRLKGPVAAPSGTTVSEEEAAP